MLQQIIANNSNDENGNPAGGSVHGVGLRIDWQRGPLGRGADRREPNGCFVETVIEAARQRLEYYQSSAFACKENAEMIHHLSEALAWAKKRTEGREARQVEGTHEK